MMATEELRTQVAADMRLRGVAAVARDLGVTREAAMAFALSVSSDGTDALVERRIAERTRKGGTK
jgi:hypothetical protein